MRQHEIQIRVRYSETDAMGFLHHANYFSYFEVGRTELFRAQGGDYRAMEEGGLFLVVAKLDCRYRVPARYDDLLTLRTAITAAEIYHADEADSHTLEDTLRFASGQIAEVTGEVVTQEVVADKGDLKNDVLPMIQDIHEGLRTYISEPLSPHGRTWTDKPAEQEAAFRANHRRITGDRGQQLLRCRGEVVERTFAHLCETGGGRRTWLRGVEKVTKRYQVLTLSHNLGLILRALIGTAKPRAFAASVAVLSTVTSCLQPFRRRVTTIRHHTLANFQNPNPALAT